MFNFVRPLLVAVFFLIPHLSFADPDKAANEIKFAQCSQFTCEAECQGSGECIWDPGKQMCGFGFHLALNRECWQITCSCQCTQRNGCQWDMATKRCEPLR